MTLLGSYKFLENRRLEGRGFLTSTNEIKSTRAS
jgi:hypothetical protein